MKDPMLGQQLANFRVERLIGQGGMAVVYYGWDVRLQRPVAIKVMDRRYRSNPSHAARFTKEAQMMAQWRHENLIQIYYAGEKQGFSYYVMEYVDGDDLATILSAYAAEKARMPDDDLLRIGGAVASALDYAHKRGVIHRDVKPSNILIAKDGRVLLGDFGMALEVSDSSMGNVFGTPHYISPEQARRSADAVPQSDLYSLGVILYEAFTGVVPFDDSSPASVALQHITQDPPPPSKFNPAISPAVEEALFKALEKKPRDRYQSGAEMMSALERALKPEKFAPMPLPALPVGAPTVRQNQVPIREITRRLPPPKKQRGNTVYRPVEEAQPIQKPRQSSSSRRLLPLFLFVLLLLLGIGGWLYYASSGLFSVKRMPTLTVSVVEPASQPVHPTQSLTQPAAAEAPPLPPPTATFTLTPYPTLAPPLPGSAPTAKPEGNRMSLFWNETSFVLLNRSREERSLAGFAFERLDMNDQPTDALPGYRLENNRFNYVPGKHCVSIKIYRRETPPYLNPFDCHGMYASVIQPIIEEHPELIFWTPKEGSTHFRVLWLKEEVARCEISAGICEMYIP